MMFISVHTPTHISSPASSRFTHHAHGSAVAGRAGMKLVHTRKLFKALRGLGSDIANEFHSLSRSPSINSKRKGDEAAAGPLA